MWPFYERNILTKHSIDDCYQQAEVPAFAPGGRFPIWTCQRTEAPAPSCSSWYCSVIGAYRFCCSRARFLLAGAHYIVDKQGGTFPTTAVELKKIPGVCTLMVRVPYITSDSL